MSFRLPLVTAMQLLPLMEECEVLIVSDEGGETGTTGKTDGRGGVHTSKRNWSFLVFCLDLQSSQLSQL